MSTRTIILYLPCWVRVDITCGTSWHLLVVRVDMGTSWYGYELTWGELTWVRVDCHPPTPFKVASVADIRLFVAKITLVVAAIIIKEHVITSSVDKITYVVAEITLKVVVVISSLAKITYLVGETTFKVAVIIFFSGLDHPCSGCDNF